jgi:hypothetical protein
MAIHYFQRLESLLDLKIESVGIRVAKLGFNIISSFRVYRIKPFSYQRFFQKKFRENLRYFNNSESFLYYTMALGTVIVRLYDPITSAPKEDIQEFTELYNQYRKGQQWSQEGIASFLDEIATQLATAT